MMDGGGAPPASVDEVREELDRLRLLQSITLELNSSLDLEALLPKVFDSVLGAVGAQGGAIWIAEGDVLRCRLALGAASQRLVGTTMPVGSGFVGDVARKQRTTIVQDAMRDARYQERVDRSSTMVATTLMATPMVTKGVTVGAIQVTNKVSGDGTGIFDDRDRELLEGLAASAAVALRNAQLVAAERRAKDLAALLEISREVTSTLDLDRVLLSVVNLASRALTFDQAAVGLVEKRGLEIRAVAGQDTVDRKSTAVQRLAARAAWAADRGEAFYLADREHVSNDGERAFVAAFGTDLEADELVAGLYLPLKDEEGKLGVLLFESKQPQFVGPTQRELAEILSNQTTVAVRNAQLYNQVPLVDALGALAAKKRALMRLPRRRRQVYAGAAVAAVAILTLVRWPLRIAGSQPSFRPAAYAEARTLVPGIIERVLVREGTAVGRGAPLVQLRDVELRAAREAAAAEAAVAQRASAAAASRTDPAEERLQRMRAQALGREVALLDEQLAAATVRAPVSGVVLTPRPEERLGTRLEAGGLVVTLGRTDTLELEFGVTQREIERIVVGQRIRLRVDAVPQRTFEGRVTSLGQLPRDTTEGVRFPVRALVPNTDGLLKPGMAPHVKVLTAPTSVAGRVLRGPARWLRLLWWRMWA